MAMQGSPVAAYFAAVSTSQLDPKNVEKLQEMMVHEIAQSCYLINRFSQLLELGEWHESEGRSLYCLLSLQSFPKA